MRRISASLTCLLAAIASCVLAPGARADELADGTRIVRQRCVACHNQEMLVAHASRAPVGEREARWERFLPGHYLPKADERAAVIAWLKENARP